MYKIVHCLHYIISIMSQIMSQKQILCQTGKSHRNENKISNPFSSWGAGCDPKTLKGQTAKHLQMTTLSRWPSTGGSYNWGVLMMMRMFEPRFENMMYVTTRYHEDAFT